MKAELLSRDKNLLFERNALMQIGWKNIYKFFDIELT